MPMLEKDPTGEPYDRFARVLKRAAMICDYVFLDTQYLPLPGRQQDRWIWDVAGGPESSLLSESRQFNRMLLRPQDVGNEEAVFAELWPRSDYTNEDNITDKAYEVVTELAATYPPLQDDYKWCGELAGILIHDMRMPLVCQQWFPNAAAILNPLHRQLLAELVPKAGDHDSQTALSQLEASNIVDFASLTWQQVLKLRRSSFWHDFRARLDSICLNDTNAAVHAWNDLWLFVDENTPHLGRASILGLANSFPLPGAALLGLAGSASDLAHTLRVRERFGWLYFLMQANPLLRKPLAMNASPEA
jgi:hypothetical protein